MNKIWWYILTSEFSQRKIVFDDVFSLKRGYPIHLISTIQNQYLKITIDIGKEITQEIRTN